MPLKPGIPNRTRGELEVWIREQARDPEIRRKLQEDPRAALEQLLGVRPPDGLRVEVVTPRPQQRVVVQRRGAAARNRVGSPPPNVVARAASVAADVLQETDAKAFLLLDPAGKHST